MTDEEKRLTVENDRMRTAIKTLLNELRHHGDRIPEEVLDAAARLNLAMLPVVRVSGSAFSAEYHTKPPKVDEPIPEIEIDWRTNADSGRGGGKPKGRSKR